MTARRWPRRYAPLKIEDPLFDRVDLLPDGAEVGDLPVGDGLVRWAGGPGVFQVVGDVRHRVHARVDDRGERCPEGVRWASVWPDQLFSLRQSYGRPTLSAPPLACGGGIR